MVARRPWQKDTIIALSSIWAAGFVLLYIGGSVQSCLLSAVILTFGISTIVVAGLASLGAVLGR